MNHSIMLLCSVVPKPTRSSASSALTGGGVSRWVERCNPTVRHAQAFRIGGFHAAVLGELAVPRRLGDLEVPAHLVEFLA